MNTAQDSPSPAAKAPSEEFLLADFNNRKEDIQRIIKQMEYDLRFGLITTGAFWTWMLSKDIRIASRAVEWTLLFIP